MNLNDTLNLDDTLQAAKQAANQYRVMVLVEGVSDRAAINTLAERLGLDLESRRIAILAMGGVTNIGHFIDLLAAHKPAITIAGICDGGEEALVRRTLERAGFGANLTRSDLETLGFFVCEADLEDEMIRSLGVDALLEVVAAQRELKAFRTFQSQPEWRDQRPEAQLRRWIGTRATRKIRYGTLLAGALDLTRMPQPLDGLLTYVSRVD